MRSEQNLSFSGVLNTDTAPEKLSPENYTDAKNIQPLTRNTESTGNHVPMLGNVEAFPIGSVSVQNKTYRLYTSNTTEPNTATLLFYNNGIQFGAPSAFWMNYHTVSWWRNVTVAAQAAAIKTAISVWDANATVTAGATYVDITLTLVTGGDYTISATTGASTPEDMTFTVLNEAYDTTMAGELKVIGSYDLLGDLYVWSTTCSDLPLKTDLTISSVTWVVAGTVTLYQVNFTSAHGLTAGQSVNFVGDVPTVLDGDWIVNSVGLTANSFVLSDYYVTTFPQTFPTSAQITLYSKSVGEVGVAKYTASTDTWNYTRIGRTKQWGFRTQKQIDAYCEQTYVKSSIYWTDNYNVPRCIYYPFEYDINDNRAAFETDGIITAINSTGLYTYETIDVESKLQITSSGARISFVQQLQSGGQVLSGNWRYSARFLTEGLSATECLDLTNPINVCLADLNGDPALIIGDEPDTVTSKINQLEVTGIKAGLFKYIELIGVNYVGNSVVGYNIKRTELSDTQTSITLNHIGSETDTTDFDLGLLGQRFEEIATAKNIDVIDKRMILSNLTTKQRVDFTNWAQTFTHSLLQQPIDSVRGEVQNTLRAAEYMLPANVNGYAGYSQNETYRFGVKLRMASGGWTEVFHIDDICFTTFSTNLKPDGTAASSDPTRRIAGLPNFNLTDAVGATTTVYIPYVRFENIDLDYKIDGISVRNLVEEISIERVEVVSEVLASGVGVLSIYGSAYQDSASAAAWVISSAAPAANPYGGTPNQLVEYPFVSGRDGDAGAPNNPQYPNNSGLFGDNMAANRTFMAFYSPDVFFGHTSLTLASGDLIINYGCPSYLQFNNGNSGGTLPSSGYAQVSGVTNVLSSTVQTITPTNVVYLAKAASTTIGAITFTKDNPVSEPVGPTTGTAPSTQGYLFVAGSNFLQPTTFNDYGLRYVQYYRKINDKYGDAEDSVYVSCGASTYVTSTSAATITMDVFGGDTFTQLNYFRHRHVTSIQNGLGGALSFYCQNKINAQMKQKSPSQTGDLYPGISLLSWLETPTDTDGTQGEAYQEGYTIRNEVKSDVAYNADATDTIRQSARIRWSGIKPQGSPADQYRTFLYLDYHDLDQSNGEIVHHSNGNGELFTWQQRAFMRQYFNTRGTLEVKNITEILIGDGSVMSRDGVTVSRYGSKHKWSIIKGRSAGGNDVFYWINTELKKALRFGYDGTVAVSDIKGLQSFFANNLTWVDSYDTPAHGTGICGVWDDRYANAIWTVRAHRDATTWLSGITFHQDQYCFYQPSTYSTFEETGEIYKCLVGTSTGQQPDLTPASWELQEHTDNGSYNEYTLVYNEFKNGFTTFATFLPKIYLKWTDTFLSPRPISPVQEVYEHNKGQYLWWYEDSGVKQTARGYIEGVINMAAEETKTYEAIGVDSETAPIRQEFSTKDHESFLTQSEFTTREDSSFSPIKRDSTSTGVNSGDTTPLFGKWMKVKTFFEVDTYQFLSNLTVKFRFRPRLKSK